MKRLVYVTSFNTVQGFWAVYQHLKLPSHLRQGCDYMFFRSGIQPYWESKENKNGGRFADNTYNCQEFSRVLKLNFFQTNNLQVQFQGPVRDKEAKSKF